MGFSIKKFGRSINKIGVKLGRTAAPILAMTPGAGMVVGQVAQAAFAAKDAKKEQKAFQRAQDAADLSVVGSSQFVNSDPIPAQYRAAGKAPQPLATDSETIGTATFQSVNFPKINPLWYAVGGLVILLLIIRRR